MARRFDTSRCRLLNARKRAAEAQARAKEEQEDRTRGDLLSGFNSRRADCDIPESTDPASDQNSEDDATLPQFESGEFRVSGEARRIGAGRELGQAALRTRAVVLHAPSLDRLLGIGQLEEVLLVQTFVPQFVVEAFNEGTIRRAEVKAGLPKLPGGVCHPYRRKWRSERSPHRVKAVAKAGGWNDLIRCSAATTTLPTTTCSPSPAKRVSGTKWLPPPETRQKLSRYGQTQKTRRQLSDDGSCDCPSWARTRTLLIQSQACCQLHQGAAKSIVTAPTTTSARSGTRLPWS